MLLIIGCIYLNVVLISANFECFYTRESLTTCGFKCALK